MASGINGNLLQKPVVKRINPYQVEVKTGKHHFTIGVDKARNLGYSIPGEVAAKPKLTRDDTYFAPTAGGRSASPVHHGDY